MENLTSRERMKQYIAEVEGSTAEYQTPIDDIAVGCKIGTRYMIEAYGITDTARFLLHQKAVGLDEVVKRIETALQRMEVTDFTKYLGRTVEVNFEIHDSFNTTVAASVAQQSPPEANRDVIDEDPHRFTSGDFLRLISKLTAHDLFDLAMELQNDFLATQKQGVIDAKVVAFIGCLWRKNIRNPKGEPGAVPFDAATNFFRHESSLLKKCPSNLQIGAAIQVLEAVGFLKRCRAGIDRAKANHLGVKPVCATYKLLNESAWDSEKPPHTPPPIASKEKEVTYSV